MAPERVGFGDRLKEAREAAGLTQLELARRLGKADTRVSEWEAGTVPRSTTLQALADVLGCSVDWLLTGNRATWHPESRAGPPTSSQSERIDAFIFEVGGIAGALPEDAAFARAQASNYIEHIMPAAGTLDEDLDVFLDVNLRKQIERRIAGRKGTRRK